MNEKEKQSFRLVFEFLEKWRGTVIETEEQWAQLAEDTGLTVQQVLTGLLAFHQGKLVEMSLAPYAVRLLPPQKCKMDDYFVI